MIELPEVEASVMAVDPAVEVGDNVVVVVGDVAGRRSYHLQLLTQRNRVHAKGRIRNESEDLQKRHDSEHNDFVNDIIYRHC